MQQLDIGSEIHATPTWEQTGSQIKIFAFFEIFDMYNSHFGLKLLDNFRKGIPQH
jgi:hypothetical protein